MHILVCIKQVLDQDIPSHAFAINRAEKRADVPGAALAMSIFDANALEAALQLRDAAGAGTTVTALSVGSRRVEEVLRKALAVTADGAVLLSDTALENLDSACIATAVAASVRQLTTEGRPVDLVLTGRQAGDWEHGQTGGMIAEALGWPCLTLVSRLTATDRGLEVRREREDGHEVIAARPPLVATITNDKTNQLRLPKVRDMMKAHRAPITTWTIGYLGLESANLRPNIEVTDLVVPEHESRCELIEGGTPAEKAALLARKLRELKIL